MKIDSPFRLSFKKYIGQFEAQMKLQMLVGFKRFYTLKVEESRPASGAYYRTFCRIMDKIQNLYFEGMAEGRTQEEARLRAFAEAYERACICEFKLNNQERLEKSYPFGIGVGFRKSSAKKRAYGEYFERCQIAEIQKNEVWIDRSEAGVGVGPGARARLFRKSFRTKFGWVFVTLLLDSTGMVGSGYGFNEESADDSAQRSALRNADFPQEAPSFKSQDSEPSIVRITLGPDYWLECYLVGHFK